MRRSDRLFEIIQILRSAGKPVTADEQETLDNPRSRSAKMRVIQKPATA